MYNYFYDYLENSPILEFRLHGKEEALPTLLDVTGFLYDFNLAYEISRLATDPQYEAYHLSRYTFFRKGRPLLNEDRLRVAKLRHESPIELVTIVAAVGGVIGAVWGVVQIVERIANFRLNREKLKLEVEQARNRQGKDASRPLVLVQEDEALFRIQRHEAILLLRSVEKRLQASPIKLEQVEVRITRRTYQQERGEADK